jgi:hypothetical protein
MPIVFRAGVQAHVQPGDSVPRRAEPCRALRVNLARCAYSSSGPVGQGTMSNASPPRLLNLATPCLARKCSANTSGSGVMCASDGLDTKTHSNGRERFRSFTGGHSQHQASNGFPRRFAIQKSRNASSDCQDCQTSSNVMARSATINSAHAWVSWFGCARSIRHTAFTFQERRPAALGHPASECSRGGIARPRAQASCAERP